MKDLAWRLGARLVASMLGVLLAALVLAQNYEALPFWIETRFIEGQEVRVDITPEFRIVSLGATSRVDLRVSIGLADLQAKAPMILQALSARQSSSEIRFSFPRIDQPVTRNGAVWIAGRIRIEARDPLFGAPIVETVNLTVALRPVLTAVSVAVTADLAGFDLGGGLMGVFGVEALLRGLVEHELRRSLNDAGDIRPAAGAARLWDHDHWGRGSRFRRGCRGPHRRGDGGAGDHSGDDGDHRDDGGPASLAGLPC
jgi:hypothetical protein